MTARLVRFARGLFFRFYIYQIVLIIVCGLSAKLMFQALVEPEIHREHGAGAWVAVWASGEFDDPRFFQKRLDDMHRFVGLRVGVYGADGTKLAGIGADLPAVPAGTVERLENAETLDLPDGSIVAGSKGADGHIARYAVTYLRFEDSRMTRNLRVLIVLLAVFVLGNIPLLRSIARPLSALSRTARAFGAGDMRARASLRRNDEIGDLASAFDEMADAVEVSRRAEKELLANVSHELRTPLSRIRVVHELAAEKFPDVAQRYMKEIAVDLGELERLIDDIIQTTRLDLVNARSGDPNPALHRERVPLGEFVEEVVQRFRDVHPDRNVHTSVDYEVSALVDRMMLKRAIGNVLENAHMYSSGGLPISVTVERGEAEAVNILVRDRGPGIAERDLPHVLTPFFRADPSRSRNTGGIGLGLSLTQRILVAHGGGVRVRSNLEEGTQVTLSVPADL